MEAYVAQNIYDKTFDSETYFERCNIKRCTFNAVCHFDRCNIIECTNTDNCRCDRSNIIEHEELPDVATADDIELDEDTNS